MVLSLSYRASVTSVVILTALQKTAILSSSSSVCQCSQAGGHCIVTYSSSPDYPKNRMTAQGVV